MLASSLTQKPIPIISLVQRPAPVASMTIRGQPFASAVLIFEDLMSEFYDSNGDIIFSDAYLSRAHLIIPVAGTSTEMTLTQLNNISDALFTEDADQNVEPRPGLGV